MKVVQYTWTGCRLLSFWTAEGGKSGSMSAGKWRHSMCLKCFRKRWPRRKHWGWQVPEKLRIWEICCFCLAKHKDGIHWKRDPKS